MVVQDPSPGPGRRRGFEEEADMLARCLSAVRLSAVRLSAARISAARLSAARPWAAALVLLAVSTLLPGCGSGGDPGGASDDLLQFVLASVPGEDGIVYSDRGVDTTGTLPLLGDLDGSSRGLTARQFLSFDASGLPGDVIVTSATLRVDLFITAGTPFETHGDVVADYLLYGALDADDYVARARIEGLGPVATEPALGPRTFDVTTSVAQALALGETRVQFRLRFDGEDGDDDFTSDYASFPEAEASVTGNGQPPRLIVILRRR